mmetsp:Transcript_25121/g.65529  ORF Transcript_25121/g.65529 Transcript_25121/m.65529 type:complete len:229 (-) Transcript_25121:208-894(-)|eukprot:CAMPEP_0182926578 /NCGR_PEP_ID=MMETSP0105_2-20130417/12156_1 /TAXON_ID=81532 ORGANISM="Acanthoeca-like sp., Strain 10tr" /NCGR_SAMPLE_ID=MMETSP0105_2 /ASSEMBLY_ACC=CAM_ASM_000205 /LENGTH=228 /DNA_ID=CAMNT_0025064477 /DNA_START=263 /DNA_END=949 /DNA_ORIENTATION=-
MSRARSDGGTQVCTEQAKMGMPTGPAKVPMIRRDGYRQTGGMTGCPMPTGQPRIALAKGAQLIHATLKIKSTMGQGLPELGLVVCAGKNQENAAHPARVEVKEVVAGSAAAAAMIEVGDRITRINSTDVAGMEIEEVVALLRKAAIDYKWTYSPIRLQLIRQQKTAKTVNVYDEDLMTLMTIAIRKNTKMVASKKPNPIRQTLLQRGFCDALDQALAANGYYDVTYTL